AAKRESKPPLLRPQRHDPRTLEKAPQSHHLRVGRQLPPRPIDFSDRRPRRRQQQNEGGPTRRMHRQQDRFGVEALDLLNDRALEPDHNETLYEIVLSSPVNGFVFAFSNLRMTHVWVASE